MSLQRLLETFNERGQSEGMGQILWRCIGVARSMGTD